MKMTFPKVLVTCGENLEKEYYEDTLNHVKYYFFTDKKYLVLPYIPKNKDIAGKTVFLPKKPFKYRKIDLEEYQKYIDTTFRNFWNDLSMIVGNEKLDNLKSIEFRILNIGSGGNAYTEDSGQIIVILRRDMPINLLFSSLLIELLPQIGYQEKYTWEEDQAIRSWLQYSTILKKYFSISPIPMLANLRKNNQQGRYQKETEKYLEELGISLKERSEDIEINNFELKLSPKELKLFKLLYSNKGQVISYDNIFDSVWNGNSDEFSLYSISKLVERLRKKLNNVGIGREIIKLYKGKGYYI